MLTFSVFRHSHCLTLTTTTNDTFEDTDVTLRCSDNGKVLGVVRWTKYQDQVAQMTIQNDVCISTGFLLNNPLYSYDCTDGRVYTLTLRRISREINGDVWKCDLGFQKEVSNEVVIYVKGNITIVWFLFKIILNKLLGIVPSINIFVIPL